MFASFLDWKTKLDNLIFYERSVKVNSKSEGIMFLGMGLGAVIVVCCIFGGIGMVCWPYTINSWLVYSGREPCIVWWQGFILGFTPFLGQATIPVMVITWILLMFL